MLPEKIKIALDRIRETSKYSVEAKLIRGAYYLYEYKFRKSGQDIRKKKYSLYIGKIELDGSFVPARHRFLKTRVKDLGEYINIKTESMKIDQIESLKYPEADDIALIKELSMNSKASVKEIATNTGLKQSTVNSRIKKLTSTYGIRRTIEMKPETFGYTRYLILAKFSSSTPNSDELKRLILQEPGIQLAVSCRGDYSLILYVLARSNEELEKMLYRIRSSHIFFSKPSIWNVSYLIEPYGWYIPFRDEFFDSIKDRVWKRSGDTPRKKPEQFFLSEYAVIKEMNSNAETSFKDIDEKYHLNPGVAQYAYHKLIAKSTIKRPTITMLKLPVKYFAFLYLVQKDVPRFNSTIIEYFKNIVEENEYPSNRFTYVADSSAPYGIVLIAPIFNDGDFESIVSSFSNVKGIKIRTAVITNTIIGEFGIRKFDIKESSNYKVLNKLLDERNRTLRKPDNQQIQK